ncbi:MULTISPECIES: glycoside hydrolase family 38 C-terminal domain-containing protein [unclassified Pseudonocardia]|uniref:alpha-mannosidase n=1 Tax=unclassified Pseudonocardia TaxID=2619320 RepID=UPI00095FFF93|nr:MULTISPECIES: glycoside hydrolase family 38 C-terminal domain-containing protein [unclassified Pseudonocardia]MBN9100993.1 alpha-mannosidase [Pseudonocardia sp.]OJY39358.1 MAG: alpha-mannosidase [Pseudonocardia sp. 73-21]
MHDDSAQVEMRLERFVRERLTPAVYRRRTPLTVTAWAAPGEPVPFATAVAQEFTPVARGQEWGRPWGTTWFHVTGEVPENEPGVTAEVAVELGWTTAQPGFQAEATAYRPDGTIVKGLHPRSRQVLAEPGPVELWLEASSNPDIGGHWSFAPTPSGDPATAGDAPLYRFHGIDAAALDVEVWELQQDVWTLRGLLAELPADLPRRAEILRALEDMVDAVDPWDVAGTAADGRAALADVLARPAYASAHRVLATGHAHIDSAWLWPTRETVRKCARTFSGVLALMDTDPDLTFACSSAQQYAWIRDTYPELFERIRARVAEGRFVPAGGMWVESDTNMPGGEAMARQFVAGKKFFAAEFGVEPLDVWLPDSFGYSAALPQIAAAAGSRWFLTQKTSWNETNRMPHHTFSWEGIDGTRLFTHFPPVDTYNAELSGGELARAQRQYAESGRATRSLVPFGWGDGGGGPTREMLAAARRTRSLEGSPQVELGSPADFFRAAEAEYPHPPVWSGELYLEFHRGTYTSQARTKRGNRRNEHRLREAELWATAAHVQRGEPYPYDVLERAWQRVLLLQFHDILPGSSIAWVHREAEQAHAEITEELEGVIADALAALAGPGEVPLVFNAAPHARDGVPALGAARPEVAGGASVRTTGEGIVLDNGLVRVVVDGDGLLSSVRDLEADREVLASPGGLLQLHRDTPNQWDAWDIDAHYRRSALDLRDAESVDVVETTPQRAEVRVRRRFGASTVEQTFALVAGARRVDVATKVDWHERQRLLKLAFPLDVHADRASSEIQFGHVQRPIHTNTSWDRARFETCAHRFVHVAETGYGAAVTNDATYGHDITRTTRDGGGTTTTVRLSLLRAPLYPDPESDQGEHELHCALVVGATIGDAVREGYRINLPLRARAGAGPVEPLVTVDDPAVVVEAVKLAEDRSGDVVVRLYEAHGSRVRTRLRTAFDAAEVTGTDLLERPLAASRALGPDAALELRPFQIVTLRLRRD